MSLHHGNHPIFCASASRYLCLAAVGLLSVSVAMADEFYLASGKVVRGAIVSQTGSQYVLQTDVGTIKIEKSDVVRTVDLGTTSAELDGDKAVKDGNLANAQTNYRQALTQARAGSVAAQRVKQKLARLSSATQQMAENEVITKFKQAQGLVQARSYDAAQTILNELLGNVAATDPLSSSILQMQAQIHYSKGLAALDAVKLDVARQEMEAAINADPTFFRAYLSLGDSFLGNSATASRGVELLEKGIAAAGDQISQQEMYGYQYKLAQKYYDLKDYAGAAAMFAALIPAREKYPAYANALDRSVESYVMMGEENLSSDFQQTISNLNAALKLNPTNQKALFLLGRIYLDMGQVENAIVTLEKLVALSGGYPEAHLFLGRAYFKAHNNKAALDQLSQEISSNPNNYAALVDRAEVLIAMGNNAAAQADLIAAKAIDPANWLAYYLDGLLALKSKDYAKARTLLVEALDRKRTAVPVYLLMGRVLMEQNEGEGARKWLEQVTSRLAGVPELSYQYELHLADALTQLGELAVRENSPRQAENYLKQALEVVPDYVPALLAMADTNILLAGDEFVGAPREQLMKDADALYQKALKIDPANPEVYLKVATFYHRTQVDNGKALRYYNLYVDNGGRDPQVNAWITEVGGEQRTELATALAAAMPVTSGPLVTTATTTLTSGPLGATITTSTVTAPLTAPVASGILLPVDAMVAETSGTTLMTTTTVGGPAGMPMPTPTPAATNMFAPAASPTPVAPPL